MTIEKAEKMSKLIGFSLITDSQDVEEISAYIRKTKTVNKHDIRGLFVSTKDGDYECVYGFKGIIPCLDKKLIKLL